MDQEPAAKRLRPNHSPSGDAAIYAEKIDALLSRNCEATIKEAVVEAVRVIDDREVTAMWEKVFAVCSRMLLNAEGESVQEMRSSRRWMDHVLVGSLDYLQQQFKAHMEAVVKSNMADGRRGGKETILSLVEAYLNITSKRSAPGRDGQHSQWAIVFYTTRVGDFKAAHELLRGMIETRKPAALLAMLEALDKASPICAEMIAREKLADEWQTASLTCQDAYKKATYAALLGMEVPETSASIEDWLWAHLIACRTGPTGGERSFRRLQSLIGVELGENYFLGEDAGGRGQLLYFTALILTGQLERAICALERADHLVHAVHIAILAYQMKLLVLSDSTNDETLVPDSLEKVNCRLNFARLLAHYVKSSLEQLGIKHAVDYYYFLHKCEVALPSYNNETGTFNDGGGAGGGGAATRSLFQLQLSRLLQKSGTQEVLDEVLGRLNLRGEREGGLIDKFSSVIDVSTLIGHVAEDVNVGGDAFKACQLIGEVAKDENVGGDAFKACQLYALANKPREAAQLMSHQLSLSAGSPSGELAKRSVKMAGWIIGLYKTRSEVSTPVATLRQLIKIHAFFAHSSRDEHETAVKLIEELGIIPLGQDTVRDSVATFDGVPQEVRRVLPDLCLSAMRCVVCLCKRAGQRRDDEMWRRTKDYAESIILYCGMVPYRFPVSTISALMQLQSQIT